MENVLDPQVNKVLVVDDEIRITEILKLYLERAGFTVLASANGKEALELIKEHHPDVIISDLMMPEIDGTVLCQMVKTDEELNNPYFIMLTAKSTVDSKIQGLKIGADDYITKPFNVKEVVARVNSAMRIKALQSEVMEKNIVLEKFKATMENELFLAGKFQSSLVPETGFIAGKVKLDYVYSPAIHVGGDIFDVMTTGSGKIAFFIADVTGHGIVAALISGMIKLSFVQAILGTDSPIEIANKINKDIVSTTTEEHFASMFLGCFDIETGKLSYVRAGHPAPYLIKGDEIVELEAPGFLVGIIDEIPLEEHSVDLTFGDKIVLFTDGITEAEGEDGELLGNDRLKEMFLKQTDNNPKEIFNKVCLWANNKFDDDVTLIQLEVLQ